MYRDKQQMDRCLQRGATAYMDECPVFDESGIQRGKGIPLNVEVTSEVRFSHLRGLRNLFLKSADCDASRQFSKPR